MLMILKKKTDVYLMVACYQLCWTVVFCFFHLSQRTTAESTWKAKKYPNQNQIEKVMSKKNWITYTYKTQQHCVLNSKHDKTSEMRNCQWTGQLFELTHISWLQLLLLFSTQWSWLERSEIVDMSHVWYKKEGTCNSFLISADGK